MIFITVRYVPNTPGGTRLGVQSTGWFTLVWVGKILDVAV
jgi:hypothetical protein